MKPLKREILDVIERYPLATLATITEEGRPWARYVVVHVDRHLNLYVPSHIDARKMGQIRSHPDVHLTCGAGEPSDTNPYLQIQGRARLSTHKQDRHHAWNPRLKEIFKGPNDPLYEVIVITPYRIEYRTHHHQIEVWER